MLTRERSIRYEYDKASFDEPLRYGAYRIYQIGDLCTDGSYHCGEHIQVCHELAYVLRGEADIKLNNTTIRAKAGDLIFIPYKNCHDIYSRSDDYRSHHIGFMIEGGIGDDKFLEEYFNNLPCTLKSGIKSVGFSFYNILTNMYNHDEFSTGILADSIRALLISAVRSFRGDRDWNYSPEIGNEHNILISQVCAYIDASVENKDTLKELSEHFNYSYSHISNVFSKAMNMSLKDYLLKRRHEKSCELLCQGLPVTVVAERVGYSSIHAFSHFFTKREGMPPGQYGKYSKGE